MKAQFSPRFFQAPAPQPGRETQQPRTQETVSITYTPEKYGPWAAFRLHDDFFRAEEQYVQIFIDIHAFVEAHCPHREPIQQAFSTFLTHLGDGTFITRLPLLYGAGKRFFETFQALLLHENIPLEKRITAVHHLSEELYVCADGAINSLIVIIRQLQCALAGNLGEALRIKEQVLEQLIQEFNVHKPHLPGMEKHHIAVYHNFLRERYGLPSLENDIHAHQASLGITHEDLQACVVYVEARLTPHHIGSIMTETYLSAVYKVIPKEGAGLTYEEASERLTALKNQLTPTYGEVPDTSLLHEINGQYYATRRPTLVNVALMHALQDSEAIELNNTLFYQYKTPDTRMPIRQFDEASQQFVIREQTLRGKTIGIHHSDTLWWACIAEENTPTLLNLSHLRPLAEEATFPALSLSEKKTLFKEALINSDAKEIAAWLPLWRKDKDLLEPYIRFIVKREELAEKTLVDLFFENNLWLNTRQYPLSAALHQLGLAALIDKNMQFLNDIQDIKLRELLRVLFNLGVEWDLYQNPYNSENFALNYLLVQNYYLGQPDTSFTEIFNHLSPDTPLIIKAAQRGWLSLTRLLCLNPHSLNVCNTVGQTALMLAAENGQVEIIKQLYLSGANTALVSPGKGTALSHAVSGGSIASVNYLLNIFALDKNILSRGILKSYGWFKGLSTNFSFDLEATDMLFGKTALMWLFTSDISAETTQKILALLLKYGANVNTRNKLNETLIDQATVFTRGCFEQLLAAGLDIHDPANAARVMAQTLAFGTRAQVEKLIALKVPVYIPTKKGLSVIEADIANGELEKAILRLSYCQKALTHHSRAAILHTISKRLLNNTIANEQMPQIEHILQMTLDPTLLTQPDSMQCTFFNEFLRYQRTTQEMVLTTHTLRRLTQQMTLLNHYTDLHFPTADGDTPLIYLLQQASAYTSTMDLESLSIIMGVLAKHTDQLTQPNRDGFTPLLIAAQTGNVRALQILFDVKPALLHHRDPQGNTALMLATNGDRLDTMDWLLSQGAKVNARNHEGYTALMFAAMRNHIAGVQTLLKNGADPRIKNHGMTAAAFARSYGHTTLAFSAVQP
jgi:ankyrin repeat protein